LECPKGQVLLPETKGRDNARAGWPHLHKGDDMRKVMVAAALLVCATSATVHAGSCQTVGQITYCDDGTTYHQVGDITYRNDGQTSQRVGDIDYRSDGTTSQKIGNIRYGSDGTTYQRIGNSVYGSDGTVCTRIGKTVSCQ
jgi:hypothetical protein